jgi:purine-binding chemotaxis protein CheW
MNTTIDTAGNSARSEDVNASEFVTMTIAGQLFGIPVLQVQDVLGPQRIARIPMAPAWVAGVLNLRGRIVTAIDVRRRLGLPKLDAAGTEMSIVVDHNAELYSLLVDEVGEVMVCRADRIGPNPPTLDPVWQEISKGIIQLDDRLMIILHVQRLFDLPHAAAA